MANFYPTLVSFYTHHTIYFCCFISPSPFVAISIRSKLQKHLAFEAELDANEGRVNDIVSDGQKLISAKHYASDRISLQIAEVKAGWEELRRFFVFILRTSVFSALFLSCFSR